MLGRDEKKVRIGIIGVGSVVIKDIPANLSVADVTL